MKGASFNGSSISAQPRAGLQLSAAESNKTSPVSIISLICGIVGFCFNPFYFTTLAAIICGIVGIATAKNSSKGMAIAGLILGICATGCQVLFDILTFGVGIFF